MHRTIAAAVILILYFTDLISATLATGLLGLGTLQIIISSLGHGLGYSLFKMNTCRKNRSN